MDNPIRFHINDGSIILDGTSKDHYNVITDLHNHSFDTEQLMFTLVYHRSLFNCSSTGSVHYVIYVPKSSGAEMQIYECAMCACDLPDSFYHPWLAEEHDVEVMYNPLCLIYGNKKHVQSRLSYFNPLLSHQEYGTGNGRRSGTPSSTTVIVEELD